LIAERQQSRLSTLRARCGDLVEPSGADDGGNGDDGPSDAPKPTVDTTPAENRLAVRTRERYAAIQELRKRGRSISAISRELRLDRRTVRRFTQATDVEQVLVWARSRSSLLDAFKPYLHEQFNAGRTDAAALTTEIKALGYRGSEQQTVRPLGRSIRRRRRRRSHDRPSRR
jgi:hypothetical protein